MSKPSSRRRLRHPSDGGYSIVEAAITIPAIILMTMTVVQFALLWHARHVGQAAARDGLEAATAYQAAPAAGARATASYLNDVAPHLLLDPAITLTQTPTTVRVSVHARVLRIIPTGTFTITETVQGPIERFVSQAPLIPAPAPAADPDPRQALRR